MANVPRLDEDHNEIGFTQGDRDDLKEALWNLKQLGSRLDKMDSRLDGSASVAELGRYKLETDRVTAKLELKLDEKERQINELRQRYAFWTGILAAMAYLEPILIKIFWH